MVWTPHLTDIVSYSYSVNQKGAHTIDGVDTPLTRIESLQRE